MELRQITEQNPWWEDKEKINEDEKVKEALLKRQKIDEITFVNEWQRAVKFVLDSPLIKDKFIFVTGSSSIALKKETFPGRHIKIRSFLPLSFKEFCNIFGSGNLKNQFNSGRDGNWVSCNHKGLFGGSGKFVHSTKCVSNRPKKGRRIF